MMLQTQCNLTIHVVWRRILKLKQLIYIGLLGSICLLNTQPVQAQDNLSELSDHKLLLSRRKARPANLAITKTKTYQSSDIQRPYTNVQDWLLAQQQMIEVTGVSLNQTNSKLEIILETSASDQLQTSVRTENNQLIVDIPQAQLKLLTEEATTDSSFKEEQPIAGITLLEVRNQDPNSIRVTVTGEEKAPQLELFDSDEGLILSFTPAVSSTQPELEPEQPSTDETSEISEPIELIVTGEQEGQYNVPSATTATKIEVPLRDLPQSIQVVPRQVIEDRQAVGINELIENVSGVQELPGYGGLSASSGYYFRGLSLAYQSLRNGFRDIGSHAGQDIANVERVEVFKGPASVLYGGRFSLGGLVNTVTKQPSANPQYELKATVGSYNFYRPTIDLTGSLVEDGSLLYRLNLAYQNAGSFRDFGRNEIFFAAPVLTWKMGERTNLTVEFEGQRTNYGFDFGFPAEPEVLQLPISRNLGEPDFQDAFFASTLVSYRFEHKFSDNWQYKQGLSALNTTGETEQVEFFFPLEDDRRTLPRSPLRTIERQQDYVFQNEISGEFKTGSLRHRVLLGLELSRWSYDFNYFRSTLDPIDIFNPIYGAQTGIFEQELHREQKSDNLGVYLQDFIEVAPNLKVLAGVRFDVNDAAVIDKVVNQPLNEQTKSSFSPRIGIVYQPSENTSLYFNWATSFNPQFFRTSRTGEQFEPTTGEQFEIGIKQDFWDNRLSATLALYQITQQNVLTTDPINPNFSIATGEQRSRGVELDIAGEILPGWKIIANYAYADGIVTQDNSIPIGDRIPGIPQQSASLWITYELPAGDLQGLGFGLGMVYASERQILLPNTFALPAYLRVDAAVSYRRENFRLGLNVKNLFNTSYYFTDTFYVYPQPPLTVLGTVSVQF